MLQNKLFQGSLEITVHLIARKQNPEGSDTTGDTIYTAACNIQKNYGSFMYLHCHFQISTSAHYSLVIFIKKLQHGGKKGY